MTEIEETEDTVEEYEVEMDIDDFDDSSEDYTESDQMDWWNGGEEVSWW